MSAVKELWEPHQLALYPYVECGAYGHAWSDSEVPTEAWVGEAVTLICHRCGGARHDAMRNHSWTLISRRYEMPDDYSFAKGERPTRREFFEELVRRRRQRRSRR